MKIDLHGLLSRAADALDRGKDDGAYAFALREVAENIERLKQNPELIDEFCELYCIREIKQDSSSGPDGTKQDLSTWCAS